MSPMLGGRTCFLFMVGRSTIDSSTRRNRFIAEKARVVRILLPQRKTQIFCSSDTDLDPFYQSYWFDIDSSDAVDSEQLGGITRFINHAPPSSVNVTARSTLRIFLLQLSP